ncbi:hypothetical protein XENTR_v10000149 [Xenopus tropicalis]|nr:hypothetical protein XENTR_v10000149 [Xenopus tropicalis]
MSSLSLSHISPLSALVWIQTPSGPVRAEIRGRAQRLITLKVSASAQLIRTADLLTGYGFHEGPLGCRTWGRTIIWIFRTQHLLN